MKKPICHTYAFTYILQCADNTLYTGWTFHLQQRIIAHNTKSSGARYTRTRRPVTLVYFEWFPTRVLAMKREIAIKRMSTARKWKLINYGNIAPNCVFGETLEILREENYSESAIIPILKEF